MVRRDQDGGHRSESRAQRFPFLHFRSTLSFHLTFHFHRITIVRTREARRDPLSHDERHLRSRDSRAEVDGGEPPTGRSSVVARGGRISSTRRFSPLRALCRCRAFDEEWRLGCDSGNGKLENLVRLALKRLNVSYLTISSRLVWFEREALVRHERGKNEERTSRYSSRRAIERLKFYSRTAASSFRRTYRRYIVRHAALRKRYLISEVYVRALTRGVPS